MRTSAILLSLALATTLQAQTATSDPADPVRILSAVDIGPAQAPVVEVELYNQSARGVVAYALILRCKGLQQKTIREIKGPEAGNDTITDSTRWTQQISCAVPPGDAEILVSAIPHRRKCSVVPVIGFKFVTGHKACCPVC